MPRGIIKGASREAPSGTLYLFKPKQNKSPLIIKKDIAVKKYESYWLNRKRIMLLFSYSGKREARDSWCGGV
jgi:hypothetical protein